ncbi:Bifunctional DNA primase/polymerase, N-terminal [Mycobacteroides abscessus subsp. bolletii]|nr:Bifunctional DNA primase/polymerase, N-terminal [Mycobacteroides abscessus subsp. bolletii]
MITKSADNGQTKKLTRRKTSSAPTQTAPARSLPDVTGLSMVDAARAYGSAGLAVLPVRDAKHPGSCVGNNWQDKSLSQDDDLIQYRWEDEYPDAWIAIHTGASGIIAFDLDTDSIPDELDWIRDGIFQATRQNGHRGHYVFATREVFINGSIVLSEGRKVGEIRSGNSVIIAEPSPHVKAETEGGQYKWHRTGAIPPMPEAARRYLRKAGDGFVRPGRSGLEFDVVADDAAAREFITTTTGNERPKALDNLTAMVRRCRSGTRDEVRNALRIAAGEARIGLYPFARAIAEIERAARDSYESRAAAGEQRATFDGHIGAHEYNRLVVNGIGCALARKTDDIAAEANREYGTDHRNPNNERRQSDWVDLSGIDEESFWNSRPVLASLRQYARAVWASPWGMLGYAMARAVATIPPHVVLPSMRGGYGSLNMFVALVAGSGGGKGTARGAAEAWLKLDPEPQTRDIGSGEGISKLFAYKSKVGSAYVQNTLRDRVFIDVPEVDNLGAQFARSGQTLGSQVRKVFSGERLGMSYADPTKDIDISPHTYRLTMAVGVQPEQSASLLADASGGTPQRFVWLPTGDDGGATEDFGATDPPRWELGTWSGPPPPAMARIAAGVVRPLDIPVPADGFVVLGVPQAAHDAVKEQARASLRKVGDADTLDAHRLFCRLKVAVALMRLDGRTDAVSQADWELAGVVMAVSDLARRVCSAALAEKAQASNRARGRADAVRASAAEEARADLDAERTERVSKKVVSILEDFGGEESRSNVRKRITKRDREFFDEVVEQELIDSGLVEVVESAGHGSKGCRLRLVEGSDSK